jgi:hypothetical protein
MRNKKLPGTFEMLPFSVRRTWLFPSQEGRLGKIAIHDAA